MDKKLIIRLDDACERRDLKKWEQMENLLDKYGVKALVGVIPHCEDEEMSGYPFDQDFWVKVDSWQKKGWQIAMHGYNHVYGTKSGGLNPVNKRSEFAGETLDVQKEKIKSGVKIMRSHGIEPKVFFAPSHTFDKNTLVALKEESDIRTISDTVAFTAYLKDGFTFVPQQKGTVKDLPFKVVTYCYHPNMMEEKDFIELEEFLKTHKFAAFGDIAATKKRSFKDVILSKAYFAKRIFKR